MQEALVVAQLVSPLPYIVFYENFLVPRFAPPSILHFTTLSDTSSHMKLHAYVLLISSLASNVFADLHLTETILRDQTLFMHCKGVPCTEQPITRSTESSYSVSLAPSPMIWGPEIQMGSPNATVYSLS